MAGAEQTGPWAREAAAGHRGLPGQRPAVGGQLREGRRAPRLPGLRVGALGADATLTGADKVGAPLGTPHASRARRALPQDGHTGSCPRRCPVLWASTGGRARLDQLGLAERSHRRWAFGQFRAKPLTIVSAPGISLVPPWGSGGRRRVPPDRRTHGVSPAQARLPPRAAAERPAVQEHGISGPKSLVWTDAGGPQSSENSAQAPQAGRGP